MVAIKLAMAERVLMMPSILKRNSPCNIEFKVRARLSKPNKTGIYIKTLSKSGEEPKRATIPGLTTNIRAPHTRMVKNRK
jgi:hypothetical protein